MHSREAPDVSLNNSMSTCYTDMYIYVSAHTPMQICINIHTSDTHTHEETSKVCGN